MPVDPRHGKIQQENHMNPKDGGDQPKRQQETVPQKQEKQQKSNGRGGSGVFCFLF